MIWISAGTLPLAVTSFYERFSARHEYPEIIRTRPDPRVNTWVVAQDDATLHISTIAIGELRKALTILLEGKRRSQLQDWLENDVIPMLLAGYYR
jgi:hypothetical protein